MAKIHRLFWLVLFGFFISTYISTPTSAQDYLPETFNEAQFIEYERQLNAILKTRRDEEKDFVNKVVVLVRLGRIPSRLVSTSYQWSMKNRPDTNYPFVYFEKVLRLQAKALDLGNEIPAFDFSIYKSAGQQSAGQQSAGQQSSAGQRTQTSRNFFSRR